MPLTIEERVREELARERRLIDAIRRDPSLLTSAAREHQVETLTALEAAWEDARSAVEALSSAVGEEASRISAEFGRAWWHMQLELRRVVSLDRPFPNSDACPPARRTR